MRKPITAYEIIDHGLDGAQYFPGCGVSFTAYADIATGNGDTFNDALDDALEFLANDWEVDGNADLCNEALLDVENEKISATDYVRDACECEKCEDKDGVIDCQGECECVESSETYYYVSVRVR